MRDIWPYFVASATAVGFLFALIVEYFSCEKQK